MTNADDLELVDLVIRRLEDLLDDLKQKRGEQKEAKRDRKR